MKTILRCILALVRVLINHQPINIKLKDTLFSDPSEHLLRTCQYIKRNSLWRKSDIILDIGAADGGTTWYFHRNFPLNQIIAFEPIPELFSTALDRFRTKQKIEMRNMALDERPGIATLNITDNYLSSSLSPIDHGALVDAPETHKRKFRLRKSLSVQVSNLDEETKSVRDILLIKLDTQGTELRILKGGVETLKRTKLVLLEMSNHQVYEKSSKYYEVDQFLREQGFNLVDIVVTYRTDEPISEFDSLYQNSSLL